jgi:MFS family permease
MFFDVEEPAHHDGAGSKPPPRLADTPRLGITFWVVVAISVVLTLARFSEAFLVLRAQNVGLPATFVPMVMVVMNIVYALAAYPAGVFSDRLGRSGVLVLGVAFLIVADLLLAVQGTVPITLLGVAFWGLHMGFTQGLFASLVADTAPVELRGTSFGLFNLTGGVAMLAASVIAGALWSAYGPFAAFLMGATFTALSGLGFLAARARLKVLAT